MVSDFTIAVVAKEFLRFVQFQKSILAYWSALVPVRQLVMSIPAYGRSYTLRSELFVVPGSPTTGPGDTGNYTQVPGFLAYNEVTVQFLVLALSLTFWMNNFLFINLEINCYEIILSSYHLC